MFYISTGDRLQRTARWLESLEGGMKYLRQVILEDKLLLCDELERQMNELVGSWYDEWEVAAGDPIKRAQFKQFKNTEERSEQIELVQERNQIRPANWPKTGAQEDFKGHLSNGRRYAEWMISVNPRLEDLVLSNEEILN